MPKRRKMISRGKTKYELRVNAIQARIRELDYINAKTVEEAVMNERIICEAFGIKPSEPGAYDLCPIHNKVRYQGQC